MPLDPRTRLAAVLYNRALTEGLRKGADIVVAPGERLLPFGRLEIDLPGGEPVWAGRPLDEFLPASDIQIRGLRNRYRQVGLGAALVARLGPVKGVAPPRYSRVPPALKVPVTVFLRLDHVREGLATGQLHGALELYSMDTASQIEVEGRSGAPRVRAERGARLHAGPGPDLGLRDPRLPARDLPSGRGSPLHAHPVPAGARAGRAHSRDRLEPGPVGGPRQRARGRSPHRVACPALVLHLQHGPAHPVFRRSPARDAHEDRGRAGPARGRTRRCATWS